MENMLNGLPSHLGNTQQIELYALQTSRAHRKYFEANRHQYKNPDLPVGFEKTNAILDYKDSIKMDGQYYHYVVLAFEQFKDQCLSVEEFNSLSLAMQHESREKTNNVFLDLDGMSDLELSDPDEEDEEEVLPPERVKIKKEVIDDEDDKNKKTHKKHKDDLPSEKVRIKKESSHEKDHKSKKTHKKHKDDDHVSRKIKKERKEERKKKSSRSRNDSSSDSDHASHKKSLPPPPPAQIKEEFMEPPQHLYGHYHCDTCNITMNSLLTYTTHINGKRHLKNLKLKNVSEVVAKTIPNCAAEADSKYPRPPKGVTRVSLKGKSKIQDVIEGGVNVPCPGLDLVTEIQGLADTQYYCSMCDSVCSPNSIIPHLTGFKHQMKSVKHFKPDTYEDIKNLPKHLVDQRIRNILKGIQHREGIGLMLVEKDILSGESRNVFDKPIRNEASTSRKNAQNAISCAIDIPFEEKFNQTAIPDTSHSDFFCRLCQSHMNSEAMWQNHIGGKRHLANLKKMPGTLPSKTRTIQVPGARAYLLEILENEDVHEPVVGLNQIQEVQITETGSQTYQCFLCGACLSSIDIIDHLLSTKHMQRYLDHIDYHGREILNGMRETAARPLLEQMCAEVEAVEGRGNPSVHVTKNALYR